MSDALIGALRKRKMQATVMGDHQGDHEQDHKGMTEAGDNRPLTDFVSNLNDQQKNHLRTILGGKDGGGDQSQNIAKGYASSEEQGKIQEQMGKQQGQGPQETEDENTGGDHVDSDSIAKSMLDSRYRNGPPEGVKPRNLNDRMKMNVAGKLKEKGKL